MKRSSTPIVTALTALLMTACGHADRTVHPNPIRRAATSVSDLASSETTFDGLTYDRDDDAVRFYGHEASRADRQAIGALVKRYYVAAARRDGAAACRLIHSLTIETAVEGYTERSGAHAASCSTILSGLFEQHRRKLVHDSATLKVVDVRVGSLTALVLLRFAKARQPDHLEVHREGAAWKLWDLLASHMP